MKLLGKPIREKIIEDIKNKIENGERIEPYIIYNSDSFEAVEYKKLVVRTLNKLGLESKEFDIKNNKEAEDAIGKANSNPLGSVFLCRPLMVENESSLFDLIDPSKDADMLTTHNFGKLAKGDLSCLSGTARSVAKIIDYYNIDVENKRTLVVGRSISVGMPVALMMTKKNSFVSISHSKIDIDQTRLMAENSDIVILATGKRGIITPLQVKQNQIIIDCGYCEDGKGDLGFIPDCKSYSPVPGGVGPATIACIIENAFEQIKNS